jgi:O-antigen/teichoic acid export membrane protein
MTAKYIDSVVINKINSTSIVFAANILAPFIIYPYLIRILGSEVYGSIVFSLSLVNVLCVLINYGFEISEIKEISKNRENKKIVSEILSQVLFTRFILLIVAIAILFTIVKNVSIFGNYETILYCSIGIMIDTALNIRFYYIGIEKVKELMYSTVLSKAFMIFGVFILVEDKDDYLNVVLVQSIAPLLISIAFILYELYRNEFVIHSISTEKLLRSLKDGFIFFISRLAVITTTQMSFIFIGMTNGNSMVAKYDLAYKLLQLIKIPLLVINQVVYPINSSKGNVAYMRYVILGLIAMYFIIHVLMYFNIEYIISIIGGSEMISAKYYVLIFSLSIYPEVISIITGAPMLLVYNYSYEYNLSLNISFIVYLIGIATLYLLGLLGIYAIIALVVFVNVFIAVLRFYYVQKYKLFTGA